MIKPDIPLLVPPSGAIEVQAERKMKMVGRGYPVIGGQSQILVSGGLAYINLGKLWTVIDVADVDAISGRKWMATNKHRQFYALSRRLCDSPSTTYLHRLILNAGRGEFVDHRDCNGLNNRRANVRLCTPSENAKNLRTPITNTSGLKGAFFSKEKSRWYSRIKCDGILINLGYFESVEEAHRAYVAAGQKYHGEFARAA